MTRALSFQRAGTYAGSPSERAILTHEQRHLRRRLLQLQSGEEVLVDLPSAIALESGDVLVLEDGRLVEIVAASEDLHAITASSAAHLHKLAWHIGNRHLPAQIEEHRLLIARDHVIRDMLTGLGASVTDVCEPFSPERGAYHGHAPGQPHSSAAHSHD